MPLPHAEIAGSAAISGTPRPRFTSDVTSFAAVLPIVPPHENGPQAYA